MTLRHAVFVFYKFFFRDNPLLRRVFQVKKMRRIRFGVLSGWRFYSALSDGLWMSLGLYERDGQRWLRGHLAGNPNFIAIDAGSYLGFYSLLIARLLHQTGGGTVYAFDPNPENIACVQRSAAANPDAKVVTVCKALGSHCGSICGSVGREISMVNLSLAAAADSPRFEIVTLDSLFESGQLPRADFLKIDVDGFEVELLRGAERLLAACRPRILIELHTHALAIGAHDLLATHGYAFTDLTGHVVSRDSLAKAPMAFDMWCEPSPKPAQAIA